MRALRKIIKFLGIALLIWIVDSALLSIATGETFGAALWVVASPARRLFRLLIVLVVLLGGFTSLMRQEMEYIRAMKMRPSRRTQLFGNAESSDKSCRLLYHSLRLAAMLKMSRFEQNNLRILCYCYDLGMAAVDGNDRYSFSSLDRSAALGADIAANIPQLARASRLLACQQEYYDGSGCHGLRGEKIPLACRIFTTAMIFDELQHGVRHLGSEEALEELRLFSGTLLDPDIVNAFNRLHTDKYTAADVEIKVYSY